MDSRSDCDGAVGILLKGCKVLLIRRFPNPGDPFSWDVGFPGGKREPRDRDCLETARREVEEEVGIDLSETRPILELPTVSPSTKRMSVAPFVFEVSASQIRPSHEVLDYAWLDISSLEKKVAFIARRGIPARVLVGEGLVIWGMTLRLMEMLLTTPIARRCRVRTNKVIKFTERP